jgi:hypothetical protein
MLVTCDENAEAAEDPQASGSDARSRPLMPTIADFDGRTVAARRFRKLASACQSREYFRDV